MRPAVLLLGVALLLPAQFNWRRAPGFSLPDTSQKWHDIADYRGKVVLLDFMRTDCPKCQTLTGLLEQIKSKYGDKVQVLSAVAPPDNLQTVKAYMAKYKVTSPIIFDCGQMMASYLKLGPANPQVHLPKLFVIDKNGMIRNEIPDDKMTPEAVLGALEAALR